MLTPAARPRRPLVPVVASPSTMSDTNATTADLWGSLTKPPVGCSSSACIVIKGESDSVESNDWLGSEDRSMGVRVFNACDFSELGALDARASSRRHRVTPPVTMAD